MVGIQGGRYLVVEFYNILVIGQYIFAVEHDMMNDVTCRIKLHVSKDRYYADGELTGEMIRALWGLQRNWHNRKLMEREVIYWG